MAKWTEVSSYTGRPVDEDAPTNFAGAGSGVDMNPTGMRKKKKKLIDARSKSYKTHRAKLEAARAKREAKRNAVKEEVELDEALSPKDKKVVDAFYKGRSMDGKILSTDGKTLEKGGMGAQTIATSSDKRKVKFLVVAKMDSKSTGEIVRYIGNTFPANVVTSDSAESVERKTFSQKVKESITEFGVESLLAEDNVDVLKSIVKSKSMKPIKLKDGTMKVDLYTASAIVQVLDKINPANKAKLTKMLNGKKSDFMRASEGIMKMIGKKR